VNVKRAQWEGLIPHAGSMSLLHEVIALEPESITCRAVSHRDPSHPLREDGVLSAVVGIEYAAQAMAVHGALRARHGRRAGMLAAVRDVVLNVERLDDVPDDLELKAQRLHDEGTRLLYEFEVLAAGRTLLRGRAVVVLESVGAA